MLGYASRPARLGLTKVVGSRTRSLLSMRYGRLLNLVPNIEVWDVLGKGDAVTGTRLNTVNRSQSSRWSKDYALGTFVFIRLFSVMGETLARPSTTQIG